MQISTDITLNLKRPNINTIVHAKQNDRLTRKVVAQLMDGDEEWTPPAGEKISTVRFTKPDGHKGFYETDENDDPAVSYSGSKATIMLAEQVLTCPGLVAVELNIYTAAGEKLSTFLFVVDVEESSVSDEEIISTDYFNVLTEQITRTIGRLDAISELTAEALESEPGEGTYVVVSGGTGEEDPYVFTFYFEEPEAESKEDKSNKVTSWNDTPDDEHYPSEKLVKDSLDEIEDELEDKQDVSNLVTSWNDTPDDEHYPSEKLTKDTIETIEDEIDTISSDIEALESGKIDQPETEGTAGQVLATYGDGRTYWKTVSGGGGGGSSDYNDLDNKPSINGVSLVGNKTLSNLGINIPTKTSDLENDSGFLTEHQDISGKLNKNVGSQYSGYFLSVDESGNIIPTELPTYDGEVV